MKTLNISLDDMFGDKIKEMRERDKEFIPDVTWFSKMEQVKVYMVRTGGSVRSSLIVYRDGTVFKLHYLVLGRTNPSKAERLKGVKCQRFEIMNNEFVFNNQKEINFSILPLQNLTTQFKREYLERN